MLSERPAFTIEAGRRRRLSLPVEGWAASSMGLGVLAGGLFAVPDCAVPEGCPLDRPVIALLVSAALLAGMAAWALLPVREERIALVRATGRLGLVAAGLLAAAALLGPGAGTAILGSVAAGLFLPIAMLSATRPEATLQSAFRPGADSLLWIRAGAYPAFALGAGIAAGAYLAARSPASATPGGGVANLLLASGLLLFGSLVLARKGTIEGPADTAEARPPARRLRVIAGMTSMLRYDFVGECALVFSAATCLTAAAVAAPSVPSIRDVGLAALLGSSAGAAVFGLLAPSIDHFYSRGRLLSVALLCGAIAPLFVAAALPSGEAFAVFAACALFTFAWASAPQRYALTFDLSSSKGRMRAACDIQAAKLAVGAAAPWVFLVAEGALAGMGLVIASAAGMLGVAAFAPTLGGLGRRQK